MTFSERMGYGPPPRPLQLESMDAQLRTAVWNGLYLSIVRPYEAAAYRSNEMHDAVMWFGMRMWVNHLGRTADQTPSMSAIASAIREEVFEGEWNRVYDLIEFAVRSGPELHGVWRAEQTQELLNTFLERENAGYRIVDGRVVAITSETELAAIEEATSSQHSEGQRRHLQSALDMLRDRANPDYRNSIKESISAVEAACRATTGTPRATLTDALKVLEQHQPGLLHPALRDGLVKLYGYTSDSKGIRHALLEQQQDPSFAEAKFMLVACSAFTSLLAELPDKSGSATNR